MAGIIHKIGETLHMGGNKEEDKHKGEGQHKTEQYHGGEGQHKTEQYHGGGEGQRKEGGGIMDKVKGKIPGVGGGTKDHENKGEKKKKKEKKKKHEGGHDSSSSSDSD